MAAILVAALFIASMPRPGILLSDHLPFSDKFIDSLRKVYSRSSDRWPAPTIDSGVVFREIGLLPDPPLNAKMDSLKYLAALGKTLFFDPRLSGSNQISCGSCHNPDLFWTDGRRLALGHDHQQNTRSTQTIENIWFQKKLFWDGRANSLEEQAKFPITSEIEMHQKLSKIPGKLRKIKGYKPLFLNAYGDTHITEYRILHALSIFQQTVSSHYTTFDFFVGGLSSRLSDQELLGMHLFRTKARCINCHNGPLFTDGQFHNLGQTFYKDSLREDLGLYNTTKNPEDVGKFRTPGLRNVTRTHPWFHRGQFTHLVPVLVFYNTAFNVPPPTAEQRKDPLFPKLSPLIKPLGLTGTEQAAIIAFLESLASNPDNDPPPALPK